MNSMAFLPEDKENMKKLLKFLIEDYESREYYNEIHVTSDGYCTIVEWDCVPFDGAFGGKFEYVDEEHLVVKDVQFPDGHYEYLTDDDEEDVINEWLKDNPGWVKDEWGTWYNQGEEESFKERVNNIKKDEQSEWEDFINE